MTPHLQTVHSFLRERALADPEKPMLGGPGGWLTRSQVLARTESAARVFLEMGIRPGDPVAVRTHRSATTVPVLFGLLAVGALAVLTDPRQEPEAYLRECEAEIPLRHVIDPASVDLDGVPGSLSLPRIDAREPAFLIFTSGSTGKKKAVMLSQYNLVNNLLDAEPLGLYSPDDVALGALPLDHVFGLVLLLGICVLGYSIYFPAHTGIPQLLEAVQRERITRMNGVPSLYLAMASQAAGFDLSSLRAGFLGGGPFTAEQFLRIETALGMTLIPAYGMSECVGISIAHWQEPQSLRAEGSAPFYARNTGKVLLDSGAEAAPGQIGEVHITGPARMVGYWPHRMPPEALLATGDLGYLDEQGRLHLTGRKKDIIIRNGNNLSVRRIEEAILSLPGVTDAAVVAMADDLQGEVPWALVAGQEPAGFRALLLKRLNKNELPARWRFVRALPLTASGKPDRQKIREVLLQWKA